MYGMIAGINNAQIRNNGYLMQRVRRIIDAGSSEYDPTYTTSSSSVTGMAASWTNETMSSLVEAGDKLYLFTTDSDITEGDNIIDGSETWTVKRELPISPGGTVLMKRIHCKK